MKKTIFTASLSIMAVLLVPGLFSVALSQNRILNQKQILKPIPAEKLVVRKSLMAYQAVPVERVTQKRARNILQNFQEKSSAAMRFERVRNLKGRFLFTSSQDPSAVFDINRQTGSFLLNFGLKKYSNEGSTRNLPSSGNAPELARKYLEETGILPKNEKEIVLAHVGGLNMAVAKDGKRKGNYKKLVTVQFSRVLNGMPVQGPGSRLLVHLGEQGSLAGMIKNWSDVKAVPVTKAEKKNDQVIQREIQDRLRRMAGQALDIKIEKSSMVLYDDGLGRIEPAMYVLAMARYEGPGREGVVEIPVDFYVPFLKQPKALFPYMKSREAKGPGGDKKQKTLKMAPSARSAGQDQTDMK